MLDLIRDILCSPSGSFASVFSLFALAFWLTHWVTKRVTQIKSDHGSLSKNVGDMDHNIDEIRRDLSYLKGTVDVIRLGVPDLTKSHSPISLTEKGIEVALELKSESIIARNWTRIYNDLEAKICDKNAYDIQSYCMETAAVQPELFFDKEALDFIKETAYKQGKPFQYYSSVFGVLIRDKYLEIKGIDKSKIDENDPTKESAK